MIKTYKSLQTSLPRWRSDVHTSRLLRTRALQNRGLFQFSCFTKCTCGLDWADFHAWRADTPVEREKEKDGGGGEERE